MVVDFDALTAIIFGILFLPIAAFLYKQRHYGTVRIIFSGVFYAYVVTILDKTMFPIFLDDGVRNSIGNNVWSHVNLIPIVKITSNEIRTSIYNVLLFIPLGYLLPLVMEKCGYRNVMAIGLVVSVIIECMQLLIALVVGFTFRYMDVNDVMFNVIGTIVGYMVFLVFAVFYRWWSKKARLPNKGIYQHINNMLG